ncbi:LysR substrate-binding domain-containing protein [Caenispirillum bisanense]|uniref:DNA-binding transcriptional regulator, LysR family n=1 Tax=Caenispirillum bisanense TaxID=414052 RepID=A0A286H1I8_9PROT|nr:LysR substrate-binding domain-containing protein [Caenispirillum bisanense]SOE01611.1 DNA-binding transcriptional regulator, LysR family [Caenispirillum bisanense]
MPDFDIALLRTFVSVIDAGGFTRAGQRVHRTQSTISQQIKKLEDQAGVALLDRSARHLRLTDDGERLLSYARRILALSSEAKALFSGRRTEEVVSIGVTEDYAVDRLPALLSRFARDHGGVRLHVRCGLSIAMLADLEAGELDLALVKHVRPGSSALATWREPLMWVTAADGGPMNEDPLPLVVFPLGCVYRDHAVHELEVMGRPWRIAYTSPNLSGVQAAVTAGLGVSLLDRVEVPAGARILGPEEGFPSMPEAEIALYARGPMTPAVQAVADLLIDSRPQCDGAAAAE